MKQILIISLLFIFHVHGLVAQNNRYTSRMERLRQHQSEKTMGDAVRKLDSLFAMSHNVEPCRADSMNNPYYASLMGSPSLYPTIVHRLMGLSADGRNGEENLLTENVQNLLKYTDWYVANACIYHPSEVIPYEASQYADNVISSVKVEHPEVAISQFKPKEKDENIVNAISDDDLDIVVRRPNFWTFKSNFSLQFTQNYVSDNWYKGGESHNALLASTVIEANYNNQQRLTFDNKLEMKLGFQTSHSDEEHKYKTNSDLLRLTNKLGLRAVKHWYYTLMLQSWTQFCKGYKSNDKRVYSDFMSPFDALLSIGMDYQQSSKNGRFTISATLSPLALKFKYVGRPSLITYYGLKENHHTNWDYGSNVTINYKWNIVKNVSWTGRVYYFTDYTKTQIEWENTFNLTINRYLSARLFVYPRFDDSRSRKDNQSDFELNELLSLGLNMNF